MPAYLSDRPGRLRIVAQRDPQPAIIKQTHRAEPLGDEVVISREPVKLFGLTVWHKTVTRPTFNTRMRRMMQRED